MASNNHHDDVDSGSDFRDTAKRSCLPELDAVSILADEDGLEDLGVRDHPVPDLRDGFSTKENVGRVKEMDDLEGRSRRNNLYALYCCNFYGKFNYLDFFNQKTLYFFLMLKNVLDFNYYVYS